MQFNKLDELGFRGMAIAVNGDITRLIASPSVLRNLSPEQISWLHAVVVAGKYN